MRGLYLLACIIASFIGAGLGVFLYKFAKYCVAAAGGFTFAWFLLATKPGGLIDSVLGRWCLFGGVSVAAFITGLPSKLTDVMMLISTAWIGATTVTLGIDCYTRAGLKEVGRAVDFADPSSTCTTSAFTASSPNSTGASIPLPRPCRSNWAF